MKQIKKAIWGVISAFAVLSACAVDGTYTKSDASTGAGDSTPKLSTAANWAFKKRAKDGGIMTLDAAKVGYVNQNVADLTLGGIDVKTINANVKPTFYGNDLFFSGSAYLNAAVDGNNLGNGISFACAVKGADASATLTKRGGGYVSFATPLSGFAQFYAADGEVRSTASSGDFAVAQGVPLVSSGATLRYQPTEAVGQVTLGDLTVSNGLTRLSVKKSTGGTSATMTVSKLAVAEDGRVVVDVSDLGGTEKVAVPAGQAVDGRFLVRDMSKTPYALGWAAVDAEKGLVFSPASFTDGQHAFRSDTDYPAVIITNSIKQTSSGTFDFGDRPGTVWFSVTGNNFGDNGYVFKGTKGVTFISPRDSSDTSKNKDTQFHFYAKNSKWTGPTRFLGSFRIWPRDNERSFPAGSDIYLTGGQNAYGPQLWIMGGVTYPQNFHFSGYGPRSDLGTGVVLHAQTASESFSGTTTLEGPAYFTFQSTGGLNFKGPVAGPGQMILNGSGSWATGGFAAFHTSNSFSGGVRVQGNSTLRLSGAADTGTGDIVMSTGRLETKDQYGSTETAAATVAGAVVSTGNNELRIVNGKLNLTGGANFKTSAFEDISELGVAGTVDLGEMTVIPGRHVFRAAGADGVVQFTASSDAAWAVATEDGEAGGKLGIVKLGSGTVTLSGRWTHTGGTEIREGTIKLENDILKSADVTYWLDPESGLVENSGKVTSWTSKSGKGLVFSQFIPNGTAVGLPTMESNAALKGKRVPTFADAAGTGAANNSALEANGSAAQREVFIVYASKKRLVGTEFTYGGIFGRSHNDSYGSLNENGIRLAYAERDNPFWRGTTNGTTFWGDVAMNGGSFGTNEPYTHFQHDTPYVLDIRHAKDFYNFGGDGKLTSSSRSSFRPCLGSYDAFADQRCFVGAIAEVVAFSRVLTDAERKRVENHLYKKWVSATGEDKYADEQMPKAGDLLPTDGKLTVARGATLDLNGVDQTVASLVGCGTIRNTSSTPAVLTVTGDYAFTGRIVGNVILNAETATVIGPATGPDRAGLNYWLDASDASTVVSDGNGVTEWKSRAGAVETFARLTDRYQQSGYMTYDAAGLGTGKPAVKMTAWAGLGSSASCTTRTLFIVGAREEGYHTHGEEGWDTLFGLKDKDCGLRHPNLHLFTFVDGASYVMTGDTVRYNRANETVGEFTLSDSTKAPHILVLRVNDGHAENVGDGTLPMAGYKAVNVLGRYAANNAMLYRFCEVIGYDRALTDGEIATVEQYLSDKWVTSSAVPSENPVLSGDRSFSVAGTPGAQPIVVNGDADLSSVSLIVTGDRKAIEENHVVFTVTGSVTGNFKSVVLPRGWALSRKGNAWYLSRKGMVFVVR